MIINKVYNKFNKKKEKLGKELGKNINLIIKDIIYNNIKEGNPIHFRIKTDTYLNDFDDISADWDIGLDISVYNGKCSYDYIKEKIKILLKQYIDDLINNNINYLYELKKNITFSYEEAIKQQKIYLQNIQNNSFNFSKNEKKISEKEKKNILDDLQNFLGKDYKNNNVNDDDYLKNLIFNISEKDFEEYINKTINLLKGNIEISKNNTNKINQFIKEINEGLNLIDFISINGIMGEDTDLILQYKLTGKIPNKLFKNWLELYINKDTVYMGWLTIDSLKTIILSYKALKTQIQKYIKEGKHSKETIKYWQNDMKDSEKIINIFKNNKGLNIYNDFLYFVIKKINIKSFAEAINLYLLKEFEIDIHLLKRENVPSLQKYKNQKLQKKDFKGFVYYDIQNLYLKGYHSKINFLTKK